MKQYWGNRGLTARIACVLFTVTTAMATAPVTAATTEAPAKNFAIVKIPEADAPQIDGLLNDAAWARAAVITDLQQYLPTDGTPSQRSEFRVMYDENTLYIAARLYETDPSLITDNILRQGQRMNAEDRIIIVLDTFNERRSGYRFEINPHGIRDDALYLDATTTQYEWDGIFFTRTARDGEGWTAELAIPFKTLSFSPENDTWGINFGRFIARNNEWHGWVARNRAMNPGASGTMTGISGLNQGLGLDVVPSVSFRQFKNHETDRSEFKTEPSLDAYYRITPSLNASITLNTDFSATEVDNRQVELDRFSLFFPEKRAFFLRDSDIFEFGRIKGISDLTFGTPSLQNGRPFFSRRIGLSAAGEPVDLVAGTKLAGRLGGFDLGALAIRQDEHDGVDAQTLFVGRAAANVLSQSSLGLIATHGNPRSNVDNSLVGADFRYFNNRLPGGKTLEGELWYQQSDTEGRDGDDAAYGARLRSPNSTGWRGGLGLKTLEDNFNPALGFVNRAGIRDYTADVGFMKRPATGPLREMFAGVDVQRIDDIDGGLQTRIVTARLFETANRMNDQIDVRAYSTKEVLTAPYEISEGVILPTGEYSFDEYGITYDSASYRPISGIISYRRGDFYSGERWRGTAELVWKPSPHFWWTSNYEYQGVELPQGDFIVRLISTRFDVLFSATWSWVTLIQYDNVSDSVAAHSRVRWIPEAGREMFIVYNHNLIDTDENGSFRSTRADGTVKLNYTFRF